MLAEVERPDACLTAVDFHVTNDCNLRCKYCYGLDAGVQYVLSARSMSRQTARDAIDFIVTHTDVRRGLGLIFFGGEPLLNFEVIQDTVRYAKTVFKASGKSIRFAITTNGTLLTSAVVEFLNEHKISVMVSLDGPRDAHDTLRPTRLDGSSYEEILPRVRALLESRDGGVTSRATVCSTNRDMIALAKHSRAVGFRRAVLCPESSILDHPFKLDGSSYEEEFDRLGEYVVETFVSGDPHVVGPFDQLLPMILFQCARSSACRVAHDYIAISPEGDIYPCHRFMGDPKFKLGDVYSGIERDRGAPFRSRPPSCSQCWARMMCAGGCRHQHYVATGGLARVSPRECRLVRALIEIAVHTCFELQDRANMRLSRWVDDLAASARRSVSQLRQ